MNKEELEEDNKIEDDEPIDREEDKKQFVEEAEEDGFEEEEAIRLWEAIDETRKGINTFKEFGKYVFAQEYDVEEQEEKASKGLRIYYLNLANYLGVTDEEVEYLRDIFTKLYMGEVEEKEEGETGQRDYIY